MSASSLFESYDAQMIDFPHDLDVPMNPSSSELFPEASMDHDPGDGSIEVDMEEYGEDHSEYEMADGTEFLVTAHDIPKQPSDSATPPVDEHGGDVPLEHGAHVVPGSEPLPSQDTSPLTQLNPVELTVSDVAGEFYRPLEGSQHPSHDGALNADSFDKLLSDGGSDRDEEFHGNASSGVASNRGLDLAQVSDEPDPGHGVLPTEAPVPLSEGYRTPLHSEVVDEGNHNGPLGHKEGHDPPSTDFPLEHAEPASHSAANEAAASHSAAEKEGGEVDDTLRISEGVYIDPPPAVLLSVGSSAEALFCLFNQPTAEVRSESPPHKGGEGAVGNYHLLLESSPTLYYEPISNVFDALRQDEEFLSSIPHGFEGELVFDACDLELTISEDNIYAREYSLHDLNVLHDGSDFAGPLRLRLTATVPRFIYRYYTLQEQVQRLDLAVGAAGDKQHDDQTHARQSEQRESRKDENRGQATTLPTDSANEAADQPTVVSDGTDGQQGGGPPLSEEPGELFIPQSAEDVDYHAVPTGEAQVLEEEDDYENTNRGVGDATTEGVLDADQLHGSADTDQATSSSGGIRFGGEQTNYHEYLLPEEYDEREGEDLDEAEAGSQFGESVQYEVEEDAAGTHDGAASAHEVEVIAGDSDSKEVTLKALRRSSTSEGSPKESSNLNGSQILPSDNTAAEDKLPTETEEHHGNDEASHHENDLKDGSTTSSRSESVATEQGPQHDLHPDDHNHTTSDSIVQLSEGTSGQATQDDGDEWGWDDADGEDDLEYWPEHDAASDNSTATLSSKASCKRGYDELDEDLGQASPGSPEPKRTRVE
ncbi:hypothetical protein EDD17DRAFT_1563660 [Pisolithus thermaeus]|nr:hypothetical protein EDD17DRAFT_1563660 [Pisolithus thermaeus]